MIYFNNAATSYPKPISVIEAMSDNLRLPPENAFRENTDRVSGLTQCRKKVASFFHTSHEDRVIFCSGSTEALNIAIHGLVKPQAQILTTQLEHNAVLRPLYKLHKENLIDLEIIPCHEIGHLDYDHFRKQLTAQTQFIVLNHASNVTGHVVDLQTIYEDICRGGEIPLIIDASQSAGSIDIDLSKFPRSILVFTGHKALHGPSGIGGLIIGSEVNLNCWKVGGSGIRSELKTMPEILPVKFEAGTANYPGIAGLSAAIETFSESSATERGRYKSTLTHMLYNALLELPGFHLFCEEPEKNPCGVISFTIDGWSVKEIGYILHESFDIRVRSGLHCAPLIHIPMNTFPDGTVRISFSCYNHPDEIIELLRALRNITGVS